MYPVFRFFFMARLPIYVQMIFNLTTEEIVSSEEKEFGYISLREVTSAGSTQGMFNGEITEGNLYLEVETRSPPPFKIRFSTSNISEITESVTSDLADENSCTFCNDDSENNLITIAGRYPVNAHTHCLQALVNYIDSFTEKHSDIIISYEI